MTLREKMKALKDRNWCPQPRRHSPAGYTRVAQNFNRRLLVIIVPATLLVAATAGLLAFLSTYVGPGSVSVDVASDKPSYLLGEQVKILVYIGNPQIWRVNYPTTMTFLIEQNGKHLNPYQETHSNLVETVVPALSKVLYYTYEWDQKTGIGNNRTKVIPGNYTFYAKLGGIQLAPLVMNSTYSDRDLYDPGNPPNSGSCIIEIKSAE